MQWIEASINTTPDRIDALTALIQEFDVTGISIEDENDFKSFLENNRQFWDYVDEKLEEQYSGRSCVKFYLAKDEYGTHALDAIQTRISEKVCVTYIDDEDWGNSWKQYYEAIRIEPRLMIVPEWLDIDEGDASVVRIEPGIGFGTGSHPTTQMVLRLLQSLPVEESRILDLGCGSGILGISALVLGCNEVVGCDIDPKSRESVYNNMEINSIPQNRFLVLTGDLLQDERLRGRIGHGFDIVLANIVADVIIPLTTFVDRFFASAASYFVCSGVIQERADDVIASLDRNDFEVLKHLQQEEWHAFLCRKKGLQPKAM